MLRTRAIAVAALATTALALSACGSDSLSTGGSTTSAPAGSSAPAPSVDAALAAKLPEKIKSAGKIVVGTDATYAPNEFLDTDGKTVKGMDVDIFDAVAAKLGVKAEYVPAGFDTIILGVSSGKYDVGVSSFSITPEREQQVNMVSYFKAGTQWITQKGNPKKVDPDNACGLSLGAQTGATQVDDLKARSEKCTAAGKPAITIVQNDDQGKVTTDVISGKTAAMLADSPIGLYAVQQTGGQLEPVGDIYDAAPYGIVVPKDQSDFAQALADALKAVAAEGQYTQALAAWGNESGAITDFAVNPVK